MEEQSTMGTWVVVAKNAGEDGKGCFIKKGFYQYDRWNFKNDPCPKCYVLIPRTCRYNDILLTQLG